MTKDMFQGDEFLRISLQGSGRLADSCTELFKQCGLKLVRNGSQDFGMFKELPISVGFCRDDDIPYEVDTGASDIGIVGENVFYEKQLDDSEFKATIAKRLGFSKCRLSLAVAQDSGFQSMTDLQGTTIATSYPQILKKYLAENGVKARTIVFSGKMESKISRGIVKAIFDIVDTGSTLRSHDLRELTPAVFKSEALLIRGSQPLSPKQELTLKRLITRIDSCLNAKNQKLVTINADRNDIDVIAKLLPGLEAPTIANLHGETDRVSISVAVDEDRIWDVLEQLEGTSASDAIVTPIEKIIRPTFGSAAKEVGGAVLLPNRDDNGQKSALRANDVVPA